MVESIGQDAPPHLLALRQEMLATPFYSLSKSMMTDFLNCLEASTPMRINLGKGGWGAQGLGQTAAQSSSHAAERSMPRQDSPQSSSHLQGSTKTYPQIHTPNPTQTTDTGGGKGGSHQTHPLQGQTYISPPSNPNHQDRRPPPRQNQPPHKPYYEEGRFRMGDDSEDRRQRKPTHTLHTARALQAHSYSDDETVSEENPPSPRRAGR
jgi:hypothetical protein